VTNSCEWHRRASNVSQHVSSTPRFELTRSFVHIGLIVVLGLHRSTSVLAAVWSIASSVMSCAVAPLIFVPSRSRVSAHASRICAKDFSDDSSDVPSRTGYASSHMPSRAALDAV
jgi:hypothetical protein